mmetsp:Transcript_3406/g.4958  ORF Transcript_3406/g.4958 Transcript_3406/m.4958 type:complete len:80 (-) Transcript_3406:1083-1322(-)
MYTQSSFLHIIQFFRLGACIPISDCMRKSIMSSLYCLLRRCLSMLGKDQIRSHSKQLRTTVRRKEKVRKKLLSLPIVYL